MDSIIKKILVSLTIAATLGSGAREASAVVPPIPADPEALAILGVFGVVARRGRTVRSLRPGLPQGRSRGDRLPAAARSIRGLTPALWRLGGVSSPPASPPGRTADPAQSVSSSTKHQPQSSPGSRDFMTGCPTS